MTFQPPPPPPPPGGQPPPPPGYGPPPGGNPYGSPGRGFDPKSVNPLDWGILAAAVLAFIFNFVHYYTYKGVYSQSGGLLGFLAALLGLVGAAMVFLPLFSPSLKMPAPPRLIGVAAFALATLITILKLLIRPSKGGCYAGFCNKITLEIGYGLIICLILFAAGTVLSLMRYKQSGGQLPGGLNRSSLGGHGPGGTPPPGGPGYGPPPGGTPPQGGPGYGQPPGGGYGPPGQ